MTSPGKRFRLTLGRKLAASLMVMSILPLLVVSGWVYQASRKAIETQVIAHLTSVADLKKAELDHWLRERFHDLEQLRHSPAIVTYLNQPAPPPGVIADPPPEGSREPTFLALAEELNSQTGYHRLTLLNPHGLILAATDPAVVGTTIAAPFVAAIAKSQEIFIEDAEGNGTGEVILRFSGPVFAPSSPVSPDQRQLVGIVALEMELTKTLFPIINHWPGMGISGETLLARRAQEQVVFLNTLRHDPRLPLQIQIPKQSALAQPAILATGGDEGVVRARDYRGVAVVAAFRYIPIMDWGFVAKIDLEEAFAPVTKTRHHILLVTSLLSLLLIAGAILLTRGITRPLLKLEEVTRRIAAGDYTLYPVAETKDEIGDLALSLATMTAKIRATREELLEYNRKLEETVSERTGQLRVSEERFRHLAENARDVIYRRALPGGAFEYVSPAAREAFGYEPEEFYADPRLFDALLHPEEPPELNRLSEQLRQGTLPTTSEYPIRHQSGETRWMLQRQVVIRDQENLPLALEGIITDITARKKMEAEKEELERQLRQSHKMEAIGTLAGGIAHDFNNILSVILGYADLIREELPPGNPALPMTGEILTAGYRARDLVRHLLTFSRKEDQKVGPLPIAQVINENIQLVRAAIPTTITIAHHIPAECGLVLANRTQLHQILMNLCTNAFHAMEESGGTLTITLDALTVDPAADNGYKNWPPGPYVRLQVRDTGHGIDPALRERIFDPYFTTKEVGKGSGMGLAIVHGIVQSYNGRIKVESEVGKGTTFEIYLPQLAGSASSRPEEESTPDPTGRERILLVDDEVTLATLGAEMLTRLGYRVTLHTSSPAALAAFAADPAAFDLVLSDQSMPILSGAELAKKLLAIRPDLPIILCTGYSSQVNEPQATLLGIKAYALKPLLKKELAKLIRQVLDK